MSVSLATTGPQLAFAEAQEDVVGSGGGVSALTKLELCQKEGRNGCRGGKEQYPLLALSKEGGMEHGERRAKWTLCCSIIIMLNSEGKWHNDNSY